MAAESHPFPSRTRPLSPPGSGGAPGGRAQVQLTRLGRRRGRAGPRSSSSRARAGPRSGGPRPGSSRSGAPRSGSRRTSSDGRTRSGSSAGARSGSAGRTSRAPRPGTRARLELGPTARRVGRQPRSEGQRARRRSASRRGCGRHAAGTAHGRGPEGDQPGEHAPAARRVRRPSVAPGALVAAGRPAGGRQDRSAETRGARPPGRSSAAGGDRGRSGAGRSAPSGQRRPPAGGQRGRGGPRQGRSSSVVLPRGASPRTPPVEAPDRREVPLWIDEGSVREEASRATERASATAAAGTRRRRRLPDDVVAELERAAGRTRAPRLEARLQEARAAFEAERYQDAVAILGPLATEVPGAAAVRELNGLTLLPARPVEEGDGRARGLPPPDRSGRSAPRPGRQLPRAAPLDSGRRAVDRAA